MSQNTILIDQIGGQDAVALIRDGKLDDLLIEAPEDDITPRPGAIYRAVVGRMMKGVGGCFVDLDEGQTGFLRETKGLAPGQPITVQVGTHAEPGKAPPVTRKVLFKSRHAILTPGAPGWNVARSIKDEETRAALSDLATEAMADGGEALGLILRSACVTAEADDIAGDISAMRQLAEAVLADDGQTPTLLVEAPGAVATAWRDWDPAAEVIREHGAFEQFDTWGALEALSTRRFDLSGGAFLTVDPTRALVAVDVNTGSDGSPASALKANRAAIRALPRALRLLGLGGIIIVDFAPLSKKDRREMETMLKAAFRADPVETSLAGWTTLGLFELQRKRERRPLIDALRAL